MLGMWIFISIQIGAIQNSTKQSVGSLKNTRVNEGNIEVSFLFFDNSVFFFFNQKETINLHVVCVFSLIHKRGKKMFCFARQVPSSKIGHARFLLSKGRCHEIEKLT